MIVGQRALSFVNEAPVHDGGLHLCLNDLVCRDGEDILAQINAAKSALHKCGQVVLEGHLQHCVRDGIEHGDAEKTIQNFAKAVERFSNMG